MKKYVAEFIGTMVLVVFGCGTAMLVGCDAANGCGYLLTALAFGLTIVAMAYSIGNISGCHINPAVTMAVFLSGRMEKKDFAGYIVAQFAGGLVGAALLAVIFNLGGVTDMTGGFGSNGLSGVNGNMIAGFIVELVLTTIFCLVILGVTDEKYGNGDKAGLVIGLALFFVHIFGIGLTGTSVNPARSFGPDIVNIVVNGAPAGGVNFVMPFIIAPLMGGMLAAVLYAYLSDGKLNLSE